MKNPFFSIIIPTYNRCDRLLKTLSSVLNQEFKNFEVIVVDDGSTDGTSLLPILFSDERISYYEIVNSERGFARNFGASKANGTYLNFFDSDDLMLPHHLITASLFIKANNSPPWFHTGYRTIDEAGKQIAEEKGTEAPEKKLIMTNYLVPDSVFIRHDFFLQNRFQEDRRMASAEDWELHLRMISRQSILTCRVVTVEMINHASRSLFTISPDRIIQRDVLMLQYLLCDELFVKQFKRDLPLFEADRYTFFALHLLIAKRRGEAWGYLKKALKTSGKVILRKRFWACMKILFLDR